MFDIHTALIVKQKPLDPRLRGLPQLLVGFAHVGFSKLHCLVLQGAQGQVIDGCGFRLRNHCLKSLQTLRPIAHCDTATMLGEASNCTLETVTDLSGLVIGGVTSLDFGLLGVSGFGVSVENEIGTLW